jgi:translation initiation factor eIF-2B subunit gamma
MLLIVPPSFHSAISNHLAENYSSTSHPRLRIDLKRHTDGEKEEDEEGSTSENNHDMQSAGRREGTARLLRRFRNHIKVC